MWVATAATGVRGIDARADAFRTLVESDLLRYYRIAAAMLGDVVEAQDAVHDATVSAWQRFGDLRDPTRFDAWFDRILVNVCRDRLRARRRRPVVDIGPLLGASALGGTEADPAVSVDAADAVEHAMRALDPDHIAVVVLRFEADLTVAAIGQRLGIPEGTVKSRLHTAMQRMRASMTEGEAQR